VLAAIGLDEAQEGVYRALVGLVVAEVSDLAHLLGTPEDDVAQVLRHLEHRGLVTRSPARPGRWVAAAPSVALGALITQQRHQLEQAERTAAALAEEYRAEAAEPSVHDLVEVVSGAGAVARRFHCLRLAAEREVCALLTGNPVVVEASQNEAEAVTAACRVTHRVVVEREALTAPGAMTDLTWALRRGEQVRVVNRVPTKLVITDRVLAMVPLTGRHSPDPTALVIHASGLLDSLTGLFERVWAEALPLLPGPDDLPLESRPDGPDATDRQILSLLLAGLTDASVAKQLGLGLRTVQRRVRRLMELAGVSTRLQLGWYAHQHGWTRL
jgi:sugar-specific transcriptional regulator TrmB/DNA-binding CsgD family transcriptional regulator